MNDRIAKTVYEPLDKSRQEFRLLEIAVPDDNNRDGPVVVTIHKVALQDSPLFAALSYVWGDPTDTVEIIANGVPRKVTRSLSEALKHVANHAIPHMNQRGDGECKRQAFRLWADAICIDQENVEERSHQVGLMGRIYSSASLVVAWLSNEDKGMPLVFSALEALCREVELVPDKNVDALYGVAWMEDHENDLFRIKETSERSNGASEGALSSATCKLCQLPYWQRVWIIQEIALSRDLIYTTPSASIHRPVFERGLRYLLHLASKNWAGGVLDKKPDGGLRKSELMDTLSWLRIYQQLPDGLNFDRILDKCFEGFCCPEVKSSGISTYSLASLSLKGFQHDATDARDQVYGLLGLTGLDITPDYTKTTQQVLLDYVRAIVSSQLGTEFELFFLETSPNGLNGGPDASDLPSWTPSSSSYGHCRADRPCHATRGLFDKYNLPGPKVHERILSAGGCVIQRIKRIIEIPDTSDSGRVEKKTWCDLLEEVASGGRAAYHTGCPMPRALWSALLRKTDCDADLSPFLAYFCRDLVTGKQGQPFLAMFQVNKLERRKEVWRTSKTRQFPGLWAYLHEDRQGLKNGVDNGTGPCQEFITNLMMTVFVNWQPMLERLQGVVELFETEGGYFGVGPKGCTVQDQVCLLKGCASPLLLRPGSGQCYSVVGPCFVLGLMDGEAKTLLQDGRCETQIFELV